MERIRSESRAITFLKLTLIGGGLLGFGLCTKAVLDRIDRAIEEAPRQATPEPWPTFLPTLTPGPRPTRQPTLTPTKPRSKGVNG